MHSWTQAPLEYNRGWKRCQCIPPEKTGDSRGTPLPPGTAGRGALGHPGSSRQMIVEEHGRHCLRERRLCPPVLARREVVHDQLQITQANHVRHAVEVAENLVEIHPELEAVFAQLRLQGVEDVFIRGSG